MGQLDAYIFGCMAVCGETGCLGSVGWQPERGRDSAAETNTFLRRVVASLFLSTAHNTSSWFALYPVL